MLYSVKAIQEGSAKQIHSQSGFHEAPRSSVPSCQLSGTGACLASQRAQLAASGPPAASLLLAP